MNMEQFAEWKKSQIGKRVLISNKKHPWYGEVGTVKDFEFFSIISKWGMVVSLDNGTSCTVFKGDEVQFL